MVELLGTQLLGTVRLLKITAAHDPGRVINRTLARGQIERMKRTIKDATVKRFPYDKHDQFARIWPTSWPLATSPAGSRHPAALRPGNTSVTVGHQSRIDPSQT